MAEVHGIENWPVTAMKAYVGHPLASASADQLANTLGVFKYGVVPGVKTIDKVADDVYDDHLNISNTDVALKGGLDIAFLNSKGFGGNNASCAVLAPRIIEKMLTKRYGEEAMKAYHDRRETVRAKAAEYEQAVLAGDLNVIYRFGENMIDESAIDVNEERLIMPGFENQVDLALPNPYEDMV